MRFNRRISNYFLNFSELSLSNVVLYSKILPDIQTLKMFTLNNLVYLNGQSVTNTNRVVYSNDFIQLVVSK
jgi:hypothetical protein